MEPQYGWNNSKNYGDRWVHSLSNNAPVQLLNPSSNTQDRRPNIGIGSILLGGKHECFGVAKAPAKLNGSEMAG